MGCSSYGYVVVGIHLSKEEIENALEKEAKNKTVTKRGCKHEFSEKAKFCPECGEKI